jgi:hypothetical protein
LFILPFLWFNALLLYLNDSIGFFLLLLCISGVFCLAFLSVPALPFLCSDSYSFAFSLLLALHTIDDLMAMLRAGSVGEAIDFRGRRSGIRLSQGQAAFVRKRQCFRPSRQGGGLL